MNLYLGTSIWEPELGNLTLGTSICPSVWEPLLENLYLGTLLWEPLFENLYLGASPWEPHLGNLYLGTSIWEPLLGNLGEWVLVLLRSAPKPLLWLKTPVACAVGEKDLTKRCFPDSSVISNGFHVATPQRRWVSQTLRGAPRNDTRIPMRSDETSS